MSVWPSGRGRKGAANDQSSSNCTVDRLSNRGDTSVSPWSAQKPGSSLYARHTQLQSHDCSARPPGPRRPTPATRRATGDLTQGQCGAVRGGESGPALAPRRQGPGRTPPAGPWWAIPSDPKSKGINCPTFWLRGPSLLNVPPHVPWAPASGIGPGQDKGLRTRSEVPSSSPLRPTRVLPVFSLQRLTTRGDEGAAPGPKSLPISIALTGVRRSDAWDSSGATPAGARPRYPGVLPGS